MYFTYYVHIVHNVWCVLVCMRENIIIGFQSLNIFDMGSRTKSLNKQPCNIL